VPDPQTTHNGQRTWVRRGALLAGVFVALVVLGGSAQAGAVAPPVPPVPVAPVAPITPVNPDRPSTLGSSFDEGSPAGTITADEGDAGSADASISLDLPGVTEKASNSVVIILLLTVLSVAPSLLVLCTSFTRIVIVLSLTRNALGLPTAPPQQVIVGLSVFLTLFVMGPTLNQMKDVALDPLLDGTISVSQAYDAAQAPLREFLLEHTREGELKMFLDASNTETPVARDEVPLVALVPAFVLSELKSGFIIGFVIFIPFLIIDIVVSAVLMGLGMMMLPPSFVSLPFKILLFVMLDGWMLVVGTLLTSYG
jgi:flagellar biosynthetic protein FliP